MQSQRHDFASDNTAGISPDAWRALEEANAGTEASYGEDTWTRELCELVREVFDHECDIFVVFNGTAANALALAQLCHSFHSVICHERAHINTDECGAPEFFSGGAKLVTIGGENGKLDLAEAEAAVLRAPDVHTSKPRVISVTQATEFGTVYRREELGRVSDFARRHSLYFHMDGARFANGLVSLGVKAKEITWQLGVDLLSFGGTKNGTGAGELVVFFDKELAREFDYRAKQGAQLASKMRFLSAPWVGLLRDGAWLRNAAHANACAESLARKLAALGFATAFPREANALFLPMPEALVTRLQARGWRFYKFVDPDVYRLMCSWATSESMIDLFIADVQELKNA
jgi:threonine aldolase